MTEQKKTINLTIPILVVLLVIASGVIGAMWMKIQKNDKSPAVAQPEEPKAVILTKEQIAKIMEKPAGEKGNKDAKVTIVEFSDFQCPYCGRYVIETYPQILQNYGDKIRYLFHDYPLPFHSNAQKAAEVARCAGDQGKYWEMHDLLFQNQADWSESTQATAFSKLAKTVSLDVKKFESCLSSGQHTQAVKDDLALGQEVGVNGTPSFFIDGYLLVGAQPYEVIKQAIEDRLNGKPINPPSQ